KPKATHAIAELVDFTDDIIAHREGRPAVCCLRVEVTPNRHIRVLQTRGEHAHSHLAAPSRRQGSVDHFQPLGTAEVSDLNNSVAQQLLHGRTPYLATLALTRTNAARLQPPAPTAGYAPAAYRTSLQRGR